MKFDFDDILLTPAAISTVKSRSEVNIFNSEGMLPIMTAPMDTVINSKNYQSFIDNKIYSVLPRGEKNNLTNSSNFNWFSYGLDEFIEVFLKSSEAYESGNKYYALIDVANGHMDYLLDTTFEVKEKFGDTISIMIGNIANPKIYPCLTKHGIDYVRCGIGAGSACTTSANAAIGYPMGSLIADIVELGEDGPKIIADGGMKNFSDIIKALALGADYVMLGGIFNKSLESSGENFINYEGFKQGYYPFDSYNCIVQCGLEPEIVKGYSLLSNENKLLTMFKHGLLYKKYRGMSTKEVQKDWGRELLRTSEGIVKYNKVEYTLSSWVENFSDYLKSAMSYCGVYDLESFKLANYELITPNAFKRFNK